MASRVGQQVTKGVLLSPRRTGRADFPHPALLKTLVSGCRGVERAGTVNQAVGDVGSTSPLPAVGRGAGCGDALSGSPADSQCASRFSRAPCAGIPTKSSSPSLSVAGSTAQSVAGSAYNPDGDPSVR